MFHPLRGQIRGEIDKPATGEEGTMVNLSGDPVFYFLVDILAGSRIIVAGRAGDGLQFRLPSCPQAASWKGAQKTRGVTWGSVSQPSREAGT